MASEHLEPELFSAKARAKDLEREATRLEALVGTDEPYQRLFRVRQARWRDGAGLPMRYDEIAAAMGCFRSETIERLSERPLQQVWRDHLLAGSLLLDDAAGYDEGAFVFLHPNENVRCVEAVEAYTECLVDGCTSFVPWTLESVVDAVRSADAGSWIRDFSARYLGTGLPPTASPSDNPMSPFVSE